MLFRSKLRDLDGTTLALKPLDPVPEVVRLVQDVQRMRGYHWRVLGHMAGFMRRYRRRLSATQLAVALGESTILCVDTATAPRFGLGGARRPRRTHVSTTEPLDDVYRPRLRVASRYEPYFRPTMVTDDDGDLTDEFADSGALDRALV